MLYTRSDGYLGLSEGRLYPLLQKLEKHGVMREKINNLQKQPTWLIVSLNATCAVMVYRISMFMFQVLCILAGKIPVRFFYGTLAHAIYLQAPIAIVICMLCTIWQHKNSRKRSRRANYILLTIFTIIAGSPLEINICCEPSFAPPVTIEKTYQIEKLITNCSTIPNKAQNEPYLDGEQ